MKDTTPIITNEGYQDILSEICISYFYRGDRVHFTLNHHNKVGIAINGLWNDYTLLRTL